MMQSLVSQERHFLSSLGAGAPGSDAADCTGDGTGTKMGLPVSAAAATVAAATECGGTTVMTGVVGVATMAGAGAVAGLACGEATDMGVLAGAGGGDAGSGSARSDCACRERFDRSLQAALHTARSSAASGPLASVACRVIDAVRPCKGAGRGNPHTSREMGTKSSAISSAPHLRIGVASTGAADWQSPKRSRIPHRPVTRRTEYCALT
jgi:hypothetical protein